MKILCGALLVVVVVGCADQDAIERGAAGAGNGGETSAGAAGGTAAGGSGDSGAAGVGDAAGSAAAAGDAGAAGASDAQPVAIWNDDSASVRLIKGDFFSGYAGFERTRAQLSAAQLAALKQIYTAPNLDSCLEDGPDVKFTVTDQSGMSALYVNDSCNPARSSFDLDQAQPFLDTIPECLLSKDEHSTALATAPSVGVGDGCLNGLFTSSAGMPTQLYLRVAVPTANVPVQLELSECGQRTFKLELLDPAGTTLLATGASTATSCQALSHSFAVTGSYVVRVTLLGGVGAGDFWFRAH